jgi:FixJ family two-component response regulator
MSPDISFKSRTDASAEAARMNTGGGETHTRGGERVELKPSIVVVDDDEPVLRSLVRLLGVHGFRAKGYSSPQCLLDEIESVAPDCVIADLSMPGFSGLDLQRALEGLSLHYPIVFITGYGDIRSSVRAMRAGAVDFLPKPIEQNEFLDAVRRALARGRAARKQAEELADLRTRLCALTRRERDVFDLVVNGRLNKQIAAELGIAEKTVKVHRARVMRKMSVKSVAGLARIAERIGLKAPAR